MKTMKKTALVIACMMFVLSSYAQINFEVQGNSRFTLGDLYVHGYVRIGQDIFSLNPLHVKGGQGEFYVNLTDTRSAGPRILGTWRGFGRVPQTRYSSDSIANNINIGMNSEGSFIIAQDNAEAITVLPSGDVGVGESHPISKLQSSIDQPSNATLLKRTGLFLDNTNTTGTFPNNPNNVALVFGENGNPKQAIVGATYANDYLNFYTGEEFTIARISIAGNGRVGIGMSPNSNQLSVNGQASKSTAGDWVANSDARLKKEINRLESESTLNKMLQLKGITYQWNDDKTGYDRPQGNMYGFTAQNIQEVFPELVSEDEKGYLQTAYGTYDAMYVESLRALNHKIENLESENKSLKDRLAKIEQLLISNNR